MAPLIVVDHLGQVGQARKRRLETAMVVTGSAMQQYQGGLFAHRAPVRHQAGALDIDKQAYIRFNTDFHGSVTFCDIGPEM